MSRTPHILLFLQAALLGAATTSMRSKYRWPKIVAGGAAAVSGITAVVLWHERRTEIRRIEGEISDLQKRSGGDPPGGANPGTP